MTRSVASHLPRDAEATPEDLLGRCARGDQAAFRVLYQAEAPRLKAVALRITRSVAVAEDVLHDVFLRIWHEADRFDPARGAARPWLTGLVRYRALDILRRSGREMSGLDLPDPEDDTPDALAQLLDSADSRALHACLGELGRDRQFLLRRAFLDGLSHTALAAETGLALGTVKSTIRRSLAMLKRCLDA